MSAPQTYYRPGLIFKAVEKSQGHQECCFSGAPEMRNIDGSLLREAIRPLWAEFGVYGGEYTYIDPLTEQTEIGSEFRGGYFDLDIQAEQKGWSENEKEIVARHMLRLEGKPGAQFTLYSAPRIGPPWPTYDSTHHSKIVEFATAIGLIAESLAYEEQNKQRKSVIEGLRAALAVPAEAAIDDAELSAV